MKYFCEECQDYWYDEGEDKHILYIPDYKECPYHEYCEKENTSCA